MIRYKISKNNVGWYMSRIDNNPVNFYDSFMYLRKNGDFERNMGTGTNNCGYRKTRRELIMIFRAKYGKIKIE